ncbi:MAG: DUF3618 domain-containing protein [Actinomycetaceae bacterium]|nr:DUF3618 domain-containing protein [Actinomycetaceae bacterium]MDY6083507.1 DUF3618 domain-containing protein [Actinomycetaceae bacterium]
MSERTPEQIDAELTRTREELTATVNELAERLNPRSLAANAKDTAKESAAKASHAARNTAADVAADVRDGDRRTIGILAGAAVATLGFLAWALKH